MNAEAKSALRLATIPKLAERPEYRDAFTVPSLRHLVFEAMPRVDSRGDTIPGNGLAEAGAIVRIGRKVLIDMDAFDAWLASHRLGGR